MQILSLFDGMSCGYLALQEANIRIRRYVAHEIDSYAVKTSTHNFPNIEHRGDVFNADFTEFKVFDFLIGGSPCTYWSIAKKEGRETEANGMGWELFSQYVRALREAKPKYFIYENNKSMSKAIRESITETFGFEPICIDSALVSAQRRQRLYWVGARNEDGTYSKVPIEQPTDRGILLKDVLDGMTDRDKARAVIGSIGRTTTREYFKKSQNTMAFEPVNITHDGKSQTLKAQYYKNSVANFCGYTSTYGATGVAEPVAINTTDNGNKARTLMAGYYKYGVATLVTNKGFKGGTTAVAEPIRVGSLPRPNGELSQSQAFRVYSVDGKSVNLSANGGGAGGKTGLYAIPVEFDGETPTKAISTADGKEYPVFEVKNGLITIKDKQYPIKLADGFVIIRKLTVRECMRLQTVPEWYEFPVSDTQAYKMLGNGWTVEVIAHLIRGTQAI